MQKSKGKVLINPIALATKPKPAKRQRVARSYPNSARALRGIRKFAKDNELTSVDVSRMSGISQKTIWAWLSYKTVEGHRLTPNNIELIDLFLSDIEEGRVKIGDGVERKPRFEEQLEMELSTPEFEEDVGSEELILRRKLKEQEVLLEAYRTGRIS